MAKVQFKAGLDNEYQELQSKNADTLYITEETIGSQQSGNLYKGDKLIASTATDKLFLDEKVTVTGVTVGNFTSGKEIPAGTSISEILKQMLMKEIDVTATKPTSTLNLAGSPTPGSYEAGTKISVTPSHTYVDGKFTGQAGYSYNLAAGCSEGATTLKKDNTVINSGELQEFVLNVETVNFSCTTAYGASSNTPKTNFGNDSKVKIDAGSTVASTKSYTGFANMFVVHVADDSTAIDSVLIRSGQKYKEGTANATYNAPAGTMRTIIAMRKDSLKSVAGNLGANITASFIKGNKVSVEGATADWTAEYNVWVYSRPAISEQESISIQF